MNANPDRGTFREIVTVSAQYRCLLVIWVLLATRVLWAGCSRSKHTQEPNKPTSRAEIAGPAAVKANADQLPGTIVTPHMECEITPGKNVLWCATFQIAWNELYGRLGGPIRWNGAPTMVDILNKRAVMWRDLDKTSYVAAAGKMTGGSDDVRQKITQELDRKFKDAASPELLSLLNTVPPGVWVMYAYMFKELPFEWAFGRMPRRLSFGGREVENFGIWQFLKKQMNEAKSASQVLIYDYRDNDDFIVELKTR